MRSPPFSSRRSRQPCHCEPVRTLVWQSVSHPHVIPAKAQPRGGIFAPKVCKAESQCEDSSTPLCSARNDTEFALRRVGNGFIRSVCGMHKCIPCASACHCEGSLLPVAPERAARESALECNPFPSISRNPIPQTHNRSRIQSRSGFLFPYNRPAAILEICSHKVRKER